MIGILRSLARRKLSHLVRFSMSLPISVVEYFEAPTFQGEDYLNEDQIFLTRDKFTLVYGMIKAVSVKRECGLRTADCGLRTVDTKFVFFCFPEPSQFPNIFAIKATQASRYLFHWVAIGFLWLNRRCPRRFPRGCFKNSLITLGNRAV